MLIPLRKQSYLAIIAFVSITIFFSCKKDNNASTPATEQPDLTTTVTASSVSGFIVDENNAPAEGVSVKIGSMSTTTNQFGFFEIKQVEVVKTAATITVSKAGYFKNTRTFGATEGKSSSTIIKLVPKIINGTIDAPAGGNISLANGLVVTLPANGVVDASTNAAYTGTISVSAYWLDPSAADFPQTNIGNQLGINLNGGLRLLNGFGGIGIELTGAGGELLQIASGKKASLILPIPSAKTASAPSSLPLWHFDESTGLWKEDGTATKSGNTYIAEVNHFSWWNAAAASLWISVTGRVLDANNNPIHGTYAYVTVTAGPDWVNGGSLNYEGYLTTYVPDATPLTLSIYANSLCNTLVYTQTFTGAGTTLDLGNIVLAANATATVTGSLVDCNGNTVTNGCVYLKGGNTYFTRYEATGTGSFSTQVMLCDNNTVTVDVIGQNIPTLECGNPASFTLTAGNNAIGTIVACGNTAQEFIFYNVDGTDHAILSPSTFYDNSFQNIRYMYGSAAGNSVTLSYDDINIGLNTDQALFHFHAYPLTDSSRTTSFIPVHITEFGNIGEYISGNFAGSVTGVPAPNTVHNVSGNFRVKRYQ